MKTNPPSNVRNRKLEAQEAEIELYKNANEEHLDRFDAKFD
jgi:hypothetical protein